MPAKHRKVQSRPNSRTAAKRTSESKAAAIAKAVGKAMQSNQLPAIEGIDIKAFFNTSSSLNSSVFDVIKISDERCHT